MPVWSLLLRLLLSLSLVLNPVATALAGAHAHQEVRAAVALDQPVAQAACHDPAPGTAQSEPNDQADGPLTQAAADCCQSDACQCACVHHFSQAVLPGLITGMDAASDAGAFRRAGALRASPALPNLIRPPISHSS